MLSTHQADDIAAICPRVVVLLDGRVRFTGTPAELAATAAGRVWTAHQRDGGVYLSWRGGDSLWRNIGDQPPDGARVVTPTVEDGYLLLSAAAGSRPGVTMSVPAVTRTEGGGGPALRGGPPPRPLGSCGASRRAEALLLLRSVLVLAGLVGGAAVIWRSVWSAEPLWWNTAWQIGYGQVALAAIVLAAAQLAACRARRDGMQDLYGSLPVSAATRTLGHLGGLAGVLPASVVLAGAAAVVAQARGAIGTPSPAVLAGGVLLVVAAGAAGVAVGTRFPHPLAGILGAMVLLVVVAQSYRLLAYPALGGTPWLFPWTAPDQLGSLPGPLAGYPPGAAHAVELAGLAVLAGAAALAVTPGRTRHRTALAVTAVVAAAAVCAGGAVQLRPIPTATVNRLVSEVANPLPAEHCSTTGQVRYCLYPGFGNLLPAVAAGAGARARPAARAARPGPDHRPGHLAGPRRPAAVPRAHQAATGPVARRTTAGGAGQRRRRRHTGGLRAGRAVVAARLRAGPARRRVGGANPVRRQLRNGLRAGRSGQGSHRDLAGHHRHPRLPGATGGRAGRPGRRAGVLVGCDREATRPSRCGPSRPPTTPSPRQHRSSPAPASCWPRRWRTCRRARSKASCVLPGRPG